MIDPAIHSFMAIGFAVLFGTAVAHKLRAPAKFVATLAEYRIVPAPLVLPTGISIMVLEGALAVGLLWPETRSVCGPIGAGLILIYGTAIGINLSRGRRDLDCGCSFRRRPIGRWMVARNLLLAAALLALSLPVSGRPLGLVDAATIVAGLIVSFLLYASADLLLGGSDSRRNYSMEYP